VAIAASRAADGGGGTRSVGDPSGNSSRQPSRTVERDPRATTTQQGSKGLIFLKKQTAYPSKALILHAHEIGTFCIDCTGTPLPMTVRRGTGIFRYGRPVRRLMPGTMPYVLGVINSGSAGWISQMWGPAAVTSERLSSNTGTSTRTTRTLQRLPIRPRSHEDVALQRRGGARRRGQAAVYHYRPRTRSRRQRGVTDRLRHRAAYAQVGLEPRHARACPRPARRATGDCGVVTHFPYQSVTAGRWMGLGGAAPARTALLARIAIRV
jgi:hypothetical protein